MENSEKQKIAKQLARYCQRFDSQNRAANSLYDVSAATVSLMLKGLKETEQGNKPEAWALIKPEMWRNVASQIGFKKDDWVIAETRDFKLLTQVLDYSKKKSKVSFIVGAEGSGKTETIEKFQSENKYVYVLKCNDFWNRKTFLSELMQSMGIHPGGYTMYEMMMVIVRFVKQQEMPIIILDEADKLNDQLFYFFITLYNNLQDYCSIIMIATEYLKIRIERGVGNRKKGYPEIFSRGGKKFIELKGVCFSDIRSVCIVNGIDNPAAIKEIFEDSKCDLRRVKEKVRAFKEFKQPAN